LHEWLNHVALKFLFKIQNVKRKTQLARDTPRVIHVIQRTTPRRQSLAVLIHTQTAPLIPQLHRKADKLMPFSFQYRRRRARIHAAAHCHCNFHKAESRSQESESRIKK